MVDASDLALAKLWAKERNSEAFSEIMRRHSAMVYATCLRILRNSAEAEEIAQECFFRLATQQEEIRSSLGGWLYRVATTQSLDRARSIQRRLRRDTAFVEGAQNSNEQQWDDVREHVDEIIANLPEKYQFPLVAHFIEGHTYDKLSEIMGIPRTTAAYRVHKAVKLVQKALARRGIIAASAAIGMTLKIDSARAEMPESLSGSLMRIAKSLPQENPRPRSMQRLRPTNPIATLSGKLWVMVALLGLLAISGVFLSWRRQTSQAIPLGKSPVSRVIAAAEQSSARSHAPTPESPKYEQYLRVPAPPASSAEKDAAPEAPPARKSDRREGYPLWDKLVTIETQDLHSGKPLSQEARTNDDGHFGAAFALPEGRYPQITLRLRRGGVSQIAVINDVSVARNEVTELGLVTVAPCDEASPEGS